MTDVDLAAIPAAVEEVAAPPARRRRWRVGVIFSYLLTVWLLLSLNFFLPRAMPGDPITAMLASSNTGLDDAERDAIERYYGLDRPVLSQYGEYLANLATGDLGVSIRYNRPVLDVLEERVPWTLLLGGTAITLATLGAIVTGIHSGWRRGGKFDRTMLAGFISVHAIPPFFLAPLAIMLFAVKLGWFPVAGGSEPFSEDWSFLRQAADVAHHLVLPAGVAAVFFSTFQYLTMRAGMVSELGSDYLLVGRAKGLAERRLKYRYAARNALLPMVSTTGLALSSAVSSGILVEAAFAYPGMGNLLFQGVGARDYPLIQGCFLLLTLSVVTFNFLSDLLYARLDPRVTR